MKILTISYLFPFPADSGYKIRVYNTLKELGKNNYVDLCCFYDGVVENSSLGHVKSFCKNVWVINKPGLSLETKIIRYVKNLLTPVPNNLFSAWDHEKIKILEQKLKSKRYDIVIAEHLIAAHILYNSRIQTDSQLLKIIINHNIESSLFRSIFFKKKMALIPYYYVKFLLLRNYEKNICNFFDLCIVMSSDDKKKFRKICSDKKFIELPNGVDTKYFVKRPLTPTNHDFYYAGIFNYFPNIDAVKYFIKEIYPEIRRKVQDARFFIVGANPPKKILRYHDNKHIFVTGYQEDIREITSRCKICVVPLQLGSGTRLKITEAMSMGIPVVSTSKGAEGLDVENGRNILIADTPISFAENVVKLLIDSSLADKLSENGRQLMERKYSWSNICDQLINEITKATHKK